MKIAFVVHDYHLAGGHSRYVVELARRFREEHEVHVFADSFAPEAEPGIAFHRVPAWRASALTTVLTFLPAAGRRVPPGFDVVHAQGLAAWRCQVVTAHICNEAWYRALAGTRGGRLRRRLFRVVVSPLERRLFRSPRVRRVIAISDRIRRDLARHYGRSEGVRVIHHGVDAGEFQPGGPADERGQALRRRLGLATGEVVFLFVGDLRKGAAVALEALGEMPGGRLVCVSHTPPSGYRRLAERLGVGERAVFAPATQDIAAYFTAADAFLFPTPYDAFGMVILEAMAAGLPVVATREAGAAELIEHRREGLLLEDPRDVETVARYGRELLADGTLRRRLGEAARRRAEAQSWDRVAAQTLAVYREAAEEGHRG